MPSRWTRAAPALLLLSLAAGSGVPVAAQTLGRLDFATSAGPEAQAKFLTGLGYLHNFEYPRAAEAFREAQRLEPGFAMAYWGEAMTHTHPVWNQQDLAAARAVLARLGPTPEARAARAPTARERGWLATVEVLYGEGSKERRDTLFAEAMERLAAAHPDDLDAQSFHALALIGLSQGVRVIPTYMRAGAIALGVLKRNPEHPGATHYAIHAFDDPAHAPLGLDAARTYSRIAPDAPHAQHMTTHIFLALGMWDEVIAQNEVALGPDSADWTPNHYSAWRLYGLLQAGRHDAAARHLAVTRRNLRPSPGARGYLRMTRAAYLVDTERWTDSAATWELDGGWAAMDAADAFALAYAALRRGDDAARVHWRGQLEAAARDTANPPAGVMLLELRAAEAQAEGKMLEAERLLREAVAREEALPVEFGPPVIVKPGNELLGEVLLSAGRGAEAAAAFRRALELAPNRWLSLRGLVLASEQAGDRATAERARETWRAIWHAADAPVGPHPVAGRERAR